MHKTHGPAKGAPPGKQVLIRFSELDHTLTSQLGPLANLLGPTGLRVSAAGHDKIKMSLNLEVASGSVTWKVIRLGGRELEMKLVGSSGVPQSALSSLQDVHIHPTLPPGMRIDSVLITPEGLLTRISGHSV
jgi:hypothetical protein